MTEASSGQLNTPEHQPVEANLDEPTTPEQNQTDSSPNGPISAAQASAQSGPRRSNEFWLALAGIAATVVGVAATAVVMVLDVLISESPLVGCHNSLKVDQHQHQAPFAFGQRGHGLADHGAMTEFAIDSLHRMAGC